MKKKLLSVLLALCMVLTLTPSWAWAATGGQARAKLNAAEQKLYDALLPRITAVANATATASEGAISTVFTIPLNELADTTADAYSFLAGDAAAKNAAGFTASDLGLEGAMIAIPNEWNNAGASTFSSDGYTAATGKLGAAVTLLSDYTSGGTFGNVISALLADCPYELYWYDKTRETEAELAPATIASAAAQWGAVALEGYSMGELDGVRVYHKGDTSTASPLTRVQYTVSTDEVNYSVGLPYLTVSLKVAKDYSAADAKNTTNASVAKLTAAKDRMTGNKVGSDANIITTTTAQSTYNRLSAFKDAICTAVSYNDGAAADGYTTTYGYGNPWQLIHAFSGTTNGQIVCEGYAKAFKHLCDQAGIECYLVTGTMSGGTGAGAHMWNVVVLGGESYLVDVTNCDGTTIGAPDKLFLKAPNDGGAWNTGYTYTIGGNNITYVYDAATQNLWGETILALANEDYGKPEITAYSNEPAALTVGTAITAMTPTYSGVNDAAASNAYVLASGALPAGLTLNANDGTISGTPTTANASPTVVTITVTDTAGATSDAFEITFPAVGKGTATATAPTAATPTYNGAPQALLNNGGATSDGTMKYSLTQNGAYTTAIPTGTDAGDYTVWYMVEGDDDHNNTEPASVAVTISPKSIAGATIADIPNQTYTASAIEPKSAVTDGSQLTEGTDFTYSWSNNVNAGTATLTVTGKGNYDSATMATKNFTIDPAAQNLTAAALNVIVAGSVDLTTAISGAQGALTFVIQDNPAATATGAAIGGDGKTLSAGAVAGDVTIKATAAASADGNYAANTTGVTFTVHVVNKTPAELAVTQEGTTYGSTLADPAYTKPDGAGDVTVTYTGTLRKNGSAYSSASKPTEAGSYTVSVSCEDATYAYSGSATFTIAPLSIAGAAVTLADQTLTYGNTPQTRNVAGVSVDAINLAASDYDVSGNTGTNAGDYTLTVTAKDNTNFTGSATKAWSIGKADSAVTAPTAAAAMTYNGTARALLATNGSATGGTMQYSLSETGTYSTEVPTATDAGTYQVWYKVVGDANHNDAAAAQVASTTVISPAPLTVTAADQTITYGEDIVTTVDKASAATLLGSDTLGSVTLTADALTAGTHSITPSAAVIKRGSTDVTANYTITPVNGTLTVNKAHASGVNVTKSVQMKDTTQTLTVPFSEFNLVPATGALTGPSVTTSATGVTAAISGDAVEVTIPDSTGFADKQTLVTLTINPNDTNYTATEIVTLTVNYTSKQVVVLAAGNLTADYKGAAYTVDDVTGKSATVGGTDVAGTWVISGTPDLTNANSGVPVTLTFTPEDGDTYMGGTTNVTVTINKVPLTITAKDQSVVAGAALPTLTVDDCTIAGLKGSDAISGVTMTYTPATPDLTAVSDSAATITPSDAVFSSGGAANYAITYAPGTLSVTSAAVAVTGVALNKTALTLTVNGSETLTATVSPDDATDKTVTWSSNAPAIATVDANGKVTAVAAGSARITVTTTDGGFTATCAVTVTAAGGGTTGGGTTGGGSVGGGGGGGGASGGSTQTSGTTETVTNADGSKTTTTTNADGSKVETTVATDGSTTTTTTAADGSATTVEKDADGSTGTVKTDKDGNTVSAEAAPSEKAIEDAQSSGEPVTLPVEVKATKNAEDAATVTVTLPETEKPVTVEVPVENLTPGTVAILVHEDGTEEIVKTSTTSEDGVVLTLDGSATLKIVDNTKTFDDVPANEWYADNVAWASSREIMNGTGNGFEPNADTSRASIAQLLFNLDGATDDGGTPDYDDVSEDDWFRASVNWITETGIAQGTGESFGANDNVSREQLAVMLYNYAQYKGYDVSAVGDMSGFADSDGVSDWAQTALAWAVGVGLINGATDENGNLILDAQGSATRAQVAAIIERFCKYVAG